MYFQRHIPVPIRNSAVVIHDWSTWIMLPWILFHSIGHLFKVRIPWPNWWRGRKTPPDWVLENKLGRRDVTKSLILFVLFILVGGWMKWMTPLLSIPQEKQKRSGYFRIYNVTNDYPRYTESDWKLTLKDLNPKQIELTMQDMRQLKWHSVIDDFHCVTGWSVRSVEFRGVYVKDVIEKHCTNIPEKGFVTAYSGDGIYFDSFTLSQLMEEESMFLFEMDGSPLKKSQGYPCRLYHPNMYGYKSVKWVTKMVMTEKRETGYWQTNGDYDLNGYL